MQSHVLDLLLRRRLVVLAGLLVFLAVVLYDASGDWQYFTWGGRILFGGHPQFATSIGHFGAPDAGGLHTYANYPILQIGPPALLLGALLALVPAIVGALVIAGLGWLTLAAIDRAFPSRPLVVLGGGTVLLLAWSSLIHYGHLDDALALAAVAGAALMVVRSRWASVGLLVGLAAAAKPWAAAIVPLVLAAPLWRERLRAGALAVSVVIVCWAPFILADSRTLHVGSESLEPSARSALAAVGVHVTQPGGLRLVQFTVGAAIVALLVWRGAWAAAPLAAFASRLLIDPMYYPYYVAALLVGALLFDASSSRKVPVLTLLVGGMWLLAGRLPDGSAAVVILCAYVVALLAALSRALPREMTVRQGLRRRQTAPSGLPG